jgi:hypothetical protein
MIMQDLTGDTVLVMSREMTGIQDPNTAVVAGGEGVKTTENKIHWHRWVDPQGADPPPPTLPLSVAKAGRNE